ncbi:carboxymuconolactone decarboxylase family protein [Streptomyces sp. NEAU-W12]|uniref:carboxymuconolactone decarboxylase family protein n=1 Tax=Streptomyces sp. NEAU-W12 TaxID=2994668 RepID=UPI00224AD137|nr:carboxymuconolactone decarboxylase family protein [Streptomyces sp. NEAU-W12]MCX2922715.1 carboxymuconolactone decarboxylase family protein [Streptomyces sp. NEAU-W12]
MDARFDLSADELGLTFAERFAGAGLLIQQSPLPRSAQELVSLRARQINGCGHCADLYTEEVAAAGESAVRLDLVTAWRESTVFTEAEQAAPAPAEEGTRLGDAHHGVSDETWARVRKHDDDDDRTAALAALVTLVNAADRLAVIVHRKGGAYGPGMLAHALD